MGRLFIGTSGYSYKHWPGVFYPPDLPQSRWLEFYCQHFDTVELNVTFYRLPARKTFEGWYKKTPADFVFAAKGSRFITHIKRMRECRQPVRVYKENASGLGEKLAIVLWQLPPNLKYNKGRLVEFCDLLKDEYPETRHAFEFRHESWLQEDCYDILTSHGFALCIPLSPAYPRGEHMTAPFTYLRFHSGEVLGNSCYTDEELRQWASKIRGWLEERGLYIYFNNDAFGFAIDNAKKLRDYINF
ncbi:MAG: DUF72 domain-containing protein [Deltaproteobacteria bacterium]|nr:DUF72 domain-containing protein [Deltaproteobacteria bacterium]